MYCRRWEWFCGLVAFYPHSRASHRWETPPRPAASWRSWPSAGSASAIWVRIVVMPSKTRKKQWKIRAYQTQKTSYSENEQERKIHPTTIQPTLVVRGKWTEGKKRGWGWKNKRRKMLEWRKKRDWSKTNLFVVSIQHIPLRISTGENWASVAFGLILNFTIYSASQIVLLILFDCDFMHKPNSEFSSTRIGLKIEAVYTVKLV